MAKAKPQPGGAEQTTAATTPESKPKGKAVPRKAAKKVTKQAATAKATPRKSTKRKSKGSRKRPGVRKRATLRKRAAAASSAPEQGSTEGQGPQETSPGQREGGQGDATVLIDEDGHHGRADMRMVAGALRRRIPVRPEVLEACLNRAARIGLSTPHERHALMAARLLLTAEQINQADEHKGQPDKLQVEAVQPMTAEMQRQAILAAIAAEKRKREKPKRERQAS